MTENVTQNTQLKNNAININQVTENVTRNTLMYMTDNKNMKKQNYLNKM